MNVFDFPLQKITDEMEQGRNILFITSSYSDNVGFNECSVEDEIAMYRDILSRYDINKVIIKPHPRSKIVYEDFFPEAYVVRERFPAEIFQLLNLPFDKVCGITSSCLHGIFPENIIELYPDVEKKYNVTKRMWT